MSQYNSLFRNISTFFPAVKHKVFVGRWSIPNKNTDMVINQIFDRNNEDHCGVCINNDSNLMKKNISENDPDNYPDEYYRPFFM